MALEHAAQKLRVRAEKILAWEREDSQPSLSQLRRLAEIYKRPLAVFYLPEPPKKFQPLRDFRRLATTGVVRSSPELSFEIRRARDRRGWALELFEQIDEPVPKFEGALSLEDHIEEAARKLRDAIGIKFEDQVQWRQSHEALKNWRLTIELAGILTFQATDTEVSEARGFSISDRPLPVVVTNIKDAPRGRIFTLLHEIAHVMLNEGGICDLEDEASAKKVEFQVEAYCNRVAGAALFPRAELLATDVVSQHKKGNPVWTDEELLELSRRFGGSQEAALVRLLTLGLTTDSFYQKKRAEFLEKYQESKKQGAGFAPHHIVAISSAGPTFAKLVIDSFNRERITASDVCDYLQIRLKHLQEVQHDLMKPTR